MGLKIFKDKISVLQKPIWMDYPAPWVLGEYRRAADVYQEHLRIIDHFDGDLKARDERIRILERENAELKAKLQTLHRRQFKPNKKKSAQTSAKDAESAKEGE